MEKAGLIKQIILAGTIILIVAGSILTLNLLSERGDRGTRERDDNTNDDGTNGPEVSYHVLNVTILDVYTTDKVILYRDPEMGARIYLVIDIQIYNDLDTNLTVRTGEIRLNGPEESVLPTLMSDFLGDSFEFYEVIPPGSFVSGLIHYPVLPERTWVNLTYEDNMMNVTFVSDVGDLTGVEFRPWKTPLLFEVTACGREPNGSGKERYLYFDLWVRNPSTNHTHFQCWLIDLMCHNGVKLDGLFVPEPTAPFPPGGNITYRVYFDINWGSPERPKTLFESLAGMFIDIDESMYEGLI